VNERVCGNCVHCISIGGGMARCDEWHYAYPWTVRRTFNAQHGVQKAVKCEDFREHTPFAEGELVEIRGWFDECGEPH